MPALVTGCAGFIGSHLTESLLADGHDVVGIDCFNDNYGRPAKLANLARAREWDSFDFVPVDLARGALADLVAGAETIFHLAAEPGVRASWQGRFETYVRNNVTATQHVLEAASAVPGVRLVYASSSSIYGHAAAYPTPESALPRPFSPYGVTKLAGEHLTQLYRQNLGLEAVSLRLFSVYGPRQRPDMAFARFCRAALEGETVTVYGEGSQVRDFTYVGDVVDALRAAAVTPDAVGGVYNVGGGTEVSVREALALVEEIAGAPVAVEHRPAQMGDVTRTAADTTRARRDLGFAPRTDVAEGLERQFAWQRGRLAGA